MPVIRLVLASASPARLATLRSAGLDPEVVVSGVDESGITAASTAELVLRLATLKADAVAAQLLGPDRSGSEATQPDRSGPETVIIGCDSLLELDGEALGKPHTADVATRRWRAMRGRSGVLHTGHCLIAGAVRIARGAATTVHFADLDDDEIAAYVATQEPLAVAGAFTLDGLGGAFVTGIDGDPHNVVGISLPLLRELIMEAGFRWPQLWSAQP